MLSKIECIARNWATVRGSVTDTLPPIALHGKLARIDDDLTIVHSSNFNIRSTHYNTEAGLAVHNAHLFEKEETPA